MFQQDLLYVFYWWSIIFLLGSVFFPLTAKIFSKFIDHGYIFSKVLGIIILTYTTWLLGITRLLPFSQPALVLQIAVFVLINISVILFYRNKNKENAEPRNWKLIIFEELLFFLTLLFWAFIKTHQPDVIGLEKYMDFGFINSILRTNYFPPQDMWLAQSPTFPGHFINYYYFGHLATAVLTRLSNIHPAITFNLMLSTIFAFTFTGAFSIALNLMRGGWQVTGQTPSSGAGKPAPIQLLFSLLTALILTLGGNLHTIYAFTRGYTPADKPVPVWQTLGTPNLQGYWYPNATRFIPFTIHEFPSYSFVVSDLHGHVLDIPFVLFTIALLLSFIYFSEDKKKKITLAFIILGLSLAIMYMTNAWDGLIYFGLSALVFFYINIKQTKSFTEYLILNTKYLILLFLLFVLFSLPFQFTFKPFVFGIGIVKDHSPWWMLMILWGFFYYCVMGFVFYLIRKYRIYSSNEVPRNEVKRDEVRSLKSSISSRFARTITKLFSYMRSIPPTYIFLLLMIIISTGLLIFPEIFYIKDIYPTHYRANTMFKLGYQAFMMLSLCSGYIIYNFYNNYKNYKGTIIKRIFLTSYFLLLTSLLFLILIYPVFSVRSYFNSLKDNKGLYGLSYLQITHPDDYQVILWFNANVKGQPTILEAVGDSYTDYSRISANTGLPTVLGWPVHEWLWRGSYAEPGKRVDEVKTIYTTKNISETKNLLIKYKIRYAVVGEMEKQKYPNLNESLFSTLGNIVYKSGKTKVYLISL